MSSTDSISELIQYSFCRINIAVIARNTASFENNPYCWEQHINLTWPVSALSSSLQIQKFAPSCFCCGCSFLFSCLACAYPIWSHKCYFDHIVFIWDFITQCPKVNYQTTTLAWHPSLYIFTSHNRHLFGKQTKVIFWIPITLNFLPRVNVTHSSDFCSYLCDSIL